MRSKSWDGVSHAHFLTFSTYRRFSLFRDPEFCRLFLRNLDAVRRRLDFEVWAYVVMPDHVHLLVWSDAEEFRISEALRQIKQPFSREVMVRLRGADDWRADELVRLDALGRPSSRVWQAGGGYDRNMVDGRPIGPIIDYIHANPVRAGLVEAPEDYLWSSAAWYLELPAEFEVDRSRHWL